MEGRDPAASPEKTAQSRSLAPRVRLSCEACRQRKVKCDKLSPCTSCQRLGFKCVPVERARLPRGRTRKAPERAGGSDKELADRVAKLEDLLRRVAAGRDAPSKPRVDEAPSFNESPVERNIDVNVAGAETWSDQNAQTAQLGDAQPVISTNLPHRTRPTMSYLGSSFWEDIMHQTQELRTVLDSRVENDQLEFKSPTGFGSAFVGSEGSESVSNSPQSLKGAQISPQTRRTLCEVYLRNVDPVFKLLHRPSLRAFLHDDQPYLDYEHDHQAPTTLAFAVFTAAVCTIDDSQCQLLFGLDKKSAFADLQRETEAALVKADFITTNDLTVLQAFVISLLAARCQDQSRRVWTMLSMALRVAQAQCLHMADPPFRVSPFEQELRRRCWLGIGMLDVAASLDRASEPMMQAAWLESLPPSNINDEDIWPKMEVPVQEPPEGTFTDLTLPLVVAASQSVCRSIAFADFMEESVKSMSVRQQILSDFQNTAANLLRGCRPDIHTFHLYAKRTTDTINGWLQLGCLRPLQRSRNFTPPYVQGDVLLRLAAGNLQMASEVYCNPAMTQWSWFGSLWVPWHGLAVALAELCVCKDPGTMSKYWPVVEQMYQRTSSMIADSQHGMLWRPLEKLMNQALNRKHELLGSQSLNQAINQVSLNGGVTVDPAQPLNTHPLTEFSMRDMGPTMATSEQMSQPMAMPTSMGLESDLGAWPNVWDAMDLTASGTQDCDVAWANYTNFIGDVYDSADSMFLPR
ncbi:hypothetical protein N7507_000968 [Penicillium longicatenatum]|nr:hypothetical protein N7507_000968 [Penicillium longicatenatum]